LKLLMRADLQKDIEFQQSQQKERDRAIAAQRPTAIKGVSSPIIAGAGQFGAKISRAVATDFAASETERN